MKPLFPHLANTLKYWYFPLIIGVLFVLFGIYIFTVPIETYITLSILFCVSFVVSGIFDIIFSWQNKDSLQGWGWYLVSGLLTLVMGAYLIMYPAITITILPFFIGFTMLFRSFQLLGFSFELRNLHVKDWGNVTIVGVLGIILSSILLANPLFTGLSIVTITALVFIMVGISSILLSFNLKKLKEFPDKLSLELKNKIVAIQNEINAQTDMK